MASDSSSCLLMRDRIPVYIHDSHRLKLAESFVIIFQVDIMVDPKRTKSKGRYRDGANSKIGNSNLSSFVSNSIRLINKSTTDIRKF